MDLAAVFLLSLLGGYYFASYWKRTAFRMQRVEGHHLYFRAAFCGVVLFGVALGLREFLLGRSPPYKAFDDWIVMYVRPALKEESGLSPAELQRRAEWVVAAGYSLFLGPIAAVALNFFTPRWWALEHSVGTLDRLLLKAHRSDMPVALTLTTGKVYIGVVISISDPISMPSVITIRPVYSGHRDPSGRMNLTTDYDKVYADLERGGAAQLELPGEWKDLFQLAIPASLITSATLFVPSVYARFTPDWRDQLAQADRKPPPQELRVEIKNAPRAS